MKGFLYIALGLFLLACDFPKDPHNSFEDARNSSLRVGVTNHPPFVEKKEGTYSGDEVLLIRDFARSEGLEITFVEGSESVLIKKLEAYDLQLVIGGFEKNTLWEQKAGLSVPYDKKHVILVPKGENKLLHKLETFLLNQKKQRHEKHP